MTLSKQLPPAPEGNDPEERNARDHRCFCGQLLARLIPQGVELKCKRCRRVDVVPWKIIKK